PPRAGLGAVKVRRGTASITSGAAMRVDEANRAIKVGRGLVRDEHVDIALTGDMGIGNTTAAAAVICALTGLDPERVVGRGTGVDDDGIRANLAGARGALQVNAETIGRGPSETLAATGGLESAGLVGVMLEAARRGTQV